MIEIMFNNDKVDAFGIMLWATERNINVRMIAKEPYTEVWRGISVDIENEEDRVAFRLKFGI